MTFLQLLTTGRQSLLPMLFLGAASASAQTPSAQTPSTGGCASLAGLPLAADLFSLPTRGGVVETARAMDKDRTGAAVAYCAVIGRIESIDPKAPAIRFQINLPEQWNGKSLQFGGGGYNGRIPDSTGVASNGLRSGPTPLARGYLTFSDDSGHQSASANDGMFAQNDEALANFGGLHIKKARDAMVHIARQRYGRAPQRIYFAGGSTGGREALTAARRWPDAYDGVISNYPTANFLNLRLENAAIASAIYQNNSAGWIPPALVDRIATESLAECDGLDGVKDGIVSNMAACRAGSAARLKRWSCGQLAAPCLTPVQVATTIKVYHEGFTAPWQAPGVGNGYKGYNVLEGVRLDVGDEPQLRNPLVDGPNAHAAIRADEFFKHFVTRDVNYNFIEFDNQRPGALAPRLKLISELIGATSPDYSAFIRHGGKVLLVHGLDDALVSPYESVRIHEAIVAAAGAKAADAFIRFYLVPGLGHGNGRFLLSWDNLEILDAWADRGISPPATPISFDANPATPATAATAGRSRPMCEYPRWPRYMGKGDPNLAASFACVR